MAKIKSVYVCQNCGAESPKWVGRCAACGEWNTYTEEIIREEKTSKIATILGETAKQKPQLITEIEAQSEKRIDTRSPELNRVLGGGLVKGSLVLIGGEPGIGKSTLVLQVALNMEGRRILYVSGEE
ncbi:MAG TPA: AAA family ATPase, partial [Paludibacteraceae bacterium]|nr:AAA family ATPase [Paludibacteraceae bacterium]